MQYQPLSIEDGEDFFHLVGDERVAKTMRFDCPKTREESDRILADYMSEGNRSFALRTESDGKFQGVFAFKTENGQDTAYLSIMLMPEMWGHGQGSHVLRDMVELARENHWYHALEGYVLESNLPSRGIAERNGFTEKERHRFPGMTEDLVVYRMEI